MFAVFFFLIDCDVHFPDGVRLTAASDEQHQQPSGSSWFTVEEKQRFLLLFCLLLVGGVCWSKRAPPAVKQTQDFWQKWTLEAVLNVNIKLERLISAEQMKSLT